MLLLIRLLQTTASFEKDATSNNAVTSVNPDMCVEPMQFQSQLTLEPSSEVFLDLECDNDGFYTQLDYKAIAPDEVDNKSQTFPSQTSPVVDFAGFLVPKSGPTVQICTQTVCEAVMPVNKNDVCTQHTSKLTLDAYTIANLPMAHDSNQLSIQEDCKAVTQVNTYKEIAQPQTNTDLNPPTSLHTTNGQDFVFTQTDFEALYLYDFTCDDFDPNFDFDEELDKYDGYQEGLIEAESTIEHNDIEDPDKHAGLNCIFNAAEVCPDVADVEMQEVANLAENATESLGKSQTHNHYAYGQVRNTTTDITAHETVNASNEEFNNSLELEHCQAEAITGCNGGEIHEITNLASLNATLKSLKSHCSQLKCKRVSKVNEKTLLRQNIKKNILRRNFTNELIAKEIGMRTNAYEGQSDVVDLEAKRLRLTKEIEYLVDRANASKKLADAAKNIIEEMDKKIDSLEPKKKHAFDNNEPALRCYYSNDETRTKIYKFTLAMYTIEEKKEYEKHVNTKDSSFSTLCYQVDYLSTIKEIIEEKSKLLESIGPVHAQSIQ